MKNLTYKLFFSFEGIRHDDKGQQKICHDLLAMVPELLSSMDTDTPYEERGLWEKFHGSCAIAATFDDAKKIGLRWLSFARDLGATEGNIWLGVTAPKVVQIIAVFKKDALDDYHEKLKCLFPDFKIEHRQVDNIAKYKTNITTNSSNIAFAYDVIEKWEAEFENSPLRRIMPYELKIMPDTQRVVWNTSLSAMLAEELQNKLRGISNGISGQPPSSPKPRL